MRGSADIVLVLHRRPAVGRTRPSWGTVGATRPPTSDPRGLAWPHGEWDRLEPR